MLRTICWGVLLAMPAAAIAVEPSVRIETLTPEVAVLYDSRVVDVTMTVVRTSDGLVLIDALASVEAGRQARKLISAWSDQPVRYLIQTHPHGDHVWGSEVFSGATRVASRATAERIVPDTEEWRAEQRTSRDKLTARLRALAPDDAARAGIEKSLAATEQDLQIMSELHLDGALPQVRLEGDGELHLGGHVFELLYVPKGHTAADLAVHVKTAGVLVTGDLVFAHQIPFLDGTDAGALGPLLAIQERLAGLVTAGTRVVPGHGRAGGGELIEEQLRYLRALQQSVRAGRDA